MNHVIRAARAYWRLNVRAWPAVKEAAPPVLLALAAVILLLPPTTR